MAYRRETTNRLCATFASFTSATLWRVFVLGRITSAVSLVGRLPFEGLELERRFHAKMTGIPKLLPTLKKC